jgi:hypothetical protein
MVLSVGRGKVVPRKCSREKLVQIAPIQAANELNRVLFQDQSQAKVSDPYAEAVARAAHLLDVCNVFKLVRGLHFLNRLTDTIQDGFFLDLFQARVKLFRKVAFMRCP